MRKVGRKSSHERRYNSVADWPNTPEIDGFFWNVSTGPTLEEARWAEENTLLELGCPWGRLALFACFGERRHAELPDDSHPAPHLPAVDRPDSGRLRDPAGGLRAGLRRRPPAAGPAAPHATPAPPRWRNLRRRTHTG